MMQNLHAESMEASTHSGKITIACTLICEAGDLLDDIGLSEASKLITNVLESM